MPAAVEKREVDYFKGYCWSGEFLPSGVIVDDRGFSLEEPQVDNGPTLDLAMGWQGFLDFQPPAEYFEAIDIEMGRSNLW